MSYHRGGQAGAVAVSYSTSPMAPHSPSRRYSSGTAGTTTTSGIGGSTSKFNAYRSTGTTSILDRPTSFYTSSTSAGTSLRSNYISSEYRRSYCASGRLVFLAELAFRICGEFRGEVGRFYLLWQSEETTRCILPLSLSLFLRFYQLRSLRQRECVLCLIIDTLIAQILIMCVKHTHLCGRSV